MANRRDGTATEAGYLIPVGNTSYPDYHTLTAGPGYEFCLTVDNINIFGYERLVTVQEAVRTGAPWAPVWPVWPVVSPGPISPDGSLPYRRPIKTARAQPTATVAQSAVKSTPVRDPNKWSCSHKKIKTDKFCPVCAFMNRRVTD